MSKPNFKVSFAFGEAVAPLVQNEADPKMLPTTICTIVDSENDPVATATVVPYHKAVSNRLVARKFAFEKALEQIENREWRKELWAIFRSECVQPENGRIKIRTIESLIRNFPGVSPEDYSGLSSAIRGVLMQIKNAEKPSKKSIIDEEAPKQIKSEIPNAEPLEVLEEAS